MGFSGHVHRGRSGDPKRRDLSPSGGHGHRQHGRPAAGRANGAGRRLTGNRAWRISRTVRPRGLADPKGDCPSTPTPADPAVSARGRDSTRTTAPPHRRQRHHQRAGRPGTPPRPQPHRGRGATARRQVQPGASRRVREAGGLPRRQSVARGPHRRHHGRFRRPVTGSAADSDRATGHAPPLLRNPHPSCQARFCFTTIGGAERIQPTRAARSRRVTLT